VSGEISSQYVVEAVPTEVIPYSGDPVKHIPQDNHVLKNRLSDEAKKSNLFHGVRHYHNEPSAFWLPL